MSDFALPAKPTRTNQSGRYTVSLTVKRVPVPVEQRAAWHEFMRGLYQRLDDMIDEDQKQKEQA